MTAHSKITSTYSKEYNLRQFYTKHKGEEKDAFTIRNLFT